MKKKSNIIKPPTKDTIGGYIVLTILMIIGIGLTIMPFVIGLNNGGNLFGVLYQSGLIIIFGMFFAGVGIFVWFHTIINTVFKPYKSVMYLKEIGDGDYSFLNQKGKAVRYNTHTFIDEKGKKIKCTPKNDIYSVGKYYEVLRTHGEIKNIIGPSVERFELKSTKESYWFNWYSPFGNFNNIFLLPIIYVIALPGVLSMFLSKGWDFIYGLIFSAVPIALIIYDFIYKIKRNRKVKDIESYTYDPTILNKELKNIDDSPELVEIQDKTYIIFGYASIIIPTIMCGIIAFIIIMMIVNAQDKMGAIIFSPFLICVIGVLIYYVVQLISFIKNQDPLYIPPKEKSIDWVRISQMIYSGGFLLFWFGFLIIASWVSLKDGETGGVLFTIPFWLVGIFMVYTNFFKKKK